MGADVHICGDELTLSCSGVRVCAWHELHTPYLINPEPRPASWYPILYLYFQGLPESVYSYAGCLLACWLTSVLPMNMMILDHTCNQSGNAIQGWKAFWRWTNSLKQAPFQMGLLAPVTHWTGKHFVDTASTFVRSLWASIIILTAHPCECLLHHEHIKWSTSLTPLGATVTFTSPMKNAGTEMHGTA